MASSAPNKALAVRSAAILTTGEVAGTSVDVNEAFNGEFNVQIDFTIGSLTNMVVRFYGSMDGTNFYGLYGTNGSALTQTLTASSTISVPVKAGGWKFMRVSCQGTGTVTSSSATVTARYLRRGSQ